MPTIRCPKCDASLDIDSDMLGQVIQCGSCSAEFTAARPDEPDPRPRLRVRPDAGDDDRPRRKEKAKGGGGLKIVLMILGGLFLLGLLVCGVGGFLVYSTVVAPVSYAEADWKTQPSPDGMMSVKFPGPVKTQTTPGVASQTQYSLEIPPPKDGVFLFGIIDVPIGGDALFESAYTSARDAMVNKPNIKLVREAGVTVAGCNGKEAEMTAGGGTIIFRMLVVKTPRGTKYVIVAAGGRSISEADRNKFLTSFQVKALAK
jgi:hypothetical protein